MDEQLQLVPSTNAAYLDTRAIYTRKNKTRYSSRLIFPRINGPTDSESEVESDDEFLCWIWRRLKSFSDLESSPDHARLITKIINEK